MDATRKQDQMDAGMAAGTPAADADARVRTQGAARRTARILAVDPDPQARRVAAFVLSTDGYCVTMLDDPAALAATVHEMRPDLVLLAIEEPHAQSLDLCRAIRRTSSVPIVLLSTGAIAEHRALGLHSGADDYLGKPYEPSELLARVAALLRRRRFQVERPAARLNVGDLTLNTAMQQVSFADGQTVELTAIETRLLHYLMRHAGRLLSLDTIAAAIWNEATPDARIRLQVNIFRLRKKLASGARQQGYITTCRNLGYRFDAQCGEDGRS